MRALFITGCLLYVGDAVSIQNDNVGLPLPNCWNKRAMKNRGAKTPCHHTWGAWKAFCNDSEAEFQDDVCDPFNSYVEAYLKGYE